MNNVPGMYVPNAAAYTFPAAVTGYDTAPSYSLTVQNTGTAAASFSAALSSGESYTVSPASQSIAAAGSAVFVISPKTGLAAGTYADTLLLSTEGVESVSIDLSFTVAESQTDAEVDQSKLGEYGHAHYAVVGKYYEFQLAATGTGPYTWEISSDSLPKGLSLDTASGKISGTPTGTEIDDNIGSTSIAFFVKVSGASGSKSSPVNISIEVIRPPELNIPTYPTECYTGVKFTKSDDSYLGDAHNSSLSWELVGTAPNGIGLDSFGTWAELSGTPTSGTEGFYNFKIRGTKYYNSSDPTSDIIGIVEHEITLTVYGALSFTDSDDLNITGLVYGQNYTPKDFSAAVSGGKAPLVFSIESGTLASGLSLSENGRLSGTPNEFAAAVNYMTIRVTDANSKTAEITISCDAVAPPAPTITPASGTSFLSSVTMKAVDIPAGCQFYSTTDGSDPRDSSTRSFSTSRTFTDTVSLRAVLKAPYSYTYSEDTLVSYTKVAAPGKPTTETSLSFVGSTYVALQSPTVGTDIHYTTDGSEPTKDSSLYIGPFMISESTTVKAVSVLSVEDESVASETASFSFVLTPGGDIRGVAGAAGGGSVSVRLLSGESELRAQSGASPFSYEFGGVENGTYTLEVSCADHVLQRRNITMDSATMEEDFSLVLFALDHIAVTTAPAKTVYAEGELFSSDGMVVTAYYNDGSSKTVSGYNWPAGALAAGTETITISYTENAVTKTAEQAIAVKARGAEGVVSGTTLSYSVIAAPANTRLIVAWYDGSDKLLGTKLIDVSEGSTYDAQTSVGAGAARYRLFLSDRTSLVPLCAPGQAT